MANYKRRKSKRSPRCTMCTQHSWKGNTKDRRPIRDRRAMQQESR